MQTEKEMRAFSKLLAVLCTLKPEERLAMLDRVRNCMIEALPPELVPQEALAGGNDQPGASVDPTEEQ